MSSGTPSAHVTLASACARLWFMGASNTAKAGPQGSASRVKSCHREIRLAFQNPRGNVFVFFFFSFPSTCVND